MLCGVHSPNTAVLGYDSNVHFTPCFLPCAPPSAQTGAIAAAKGLLQFGAKALQLIAGDIANGNEGNRSRCGHA